MIKPVLNENDLMVNETLVELNFEGISSYAKYSVLNMRLFTNSAGEVYYIVDVISGTHIMNFNKPEYDLLKQIVPLYDHWEIYQSDLTDGSIIIVPDEYRHIVPW